jgi:hypothetical protein
MGETLLVEGAMRPNASVNHAAKPLRHRPRYYSKAEALEINQRSGELCSAAKKISHRAERLVEASRELKRVTTGLIRKVKAADSKRHESARSG